MAFSPPFGFRSRLQEKRYLESPWSMTLKEWVNDPIIFGNDLMF